MSTPKQQILRAVSPTEYYQSEFPSWNGDDSLVNCPKHNDHNDSLSFNVDTGAFFCFGCGWKGTSIIGYHADVHCDGDFNRALRALYSRYVQPTYSDATVRTYHKALIRNQKLMVALMSRRGWTEKTAEALRLGWCRRLMRLAIPIFNSAGWCVDIRYHDSLYRAPLSKRGKRVGMLNKRGAANGQWFPVTDRINPFAIKQKELWICEGEPDAITLFQKGFNVVTVTGGAKALEGLSGSKLKQLEGKAVVIARHNDPAGEKAADALLRLVAQVDVASVKIIMPPEGKDFNDYFCRFYGRSSMLRSHALSTPYSVRPSKRTMEVVHLAKTSNPEFAGSWLQTDILVNGQHHTPYGIPKLINFGCIGEQCPSCPCKDKGTFQYVVQKDDPRLMDWLKVHAKGYEGLIKADLKLPKECRFTLEVLETQNIEALSVIPALTTRTSSDSEQYVVRSAYSLDANVEANQQYRVTAKPLIDPKTKENILLVDKATGSLDSIHNFELTPAEVEQLKEVFSDDPLTIIKDVADMMAHNHTHIYGRPDLHCAVDLVYHSPRNLVFDGVPLRRGSLDVLLLGDTRCGKGQVVEGFIAAYDLGTIVSGENSSFVGLCGGLTRLNDNFVLSWGAIPLNNGRLVAVDEFSGLSDDVLARLSRVRSEGVAEIAKGGIISKTAANTRLIWIANPRKGRDISSYGSGVQAIMDLVRTNEDVARFDLALVVSKGEVDIETINATKATRKESKYTKELLRKVVLWCWSRKDCQISFHPDSISLILTEASRLSSLYSSSIPLIQGENARFKLAKLAAAVAGRCFSTQDGYTLSVQAAHAKTAVRLMQAFYNKPSMGYRTYSEMEAVSTRMRDRSELVRWFKTFSETDREILINGLLAVDEFGVREMQDWTGVDMNLGRRFISTLVRCRAIAQKGAGVYTKQREFTNFLRKHNHATQTQAR